MSSSDYYMIKSGESTVIVKKSRVNYLCEQIVFSGTESEAMAEWNRLHRITIPIRKLRLA